VYMYMVGQQPSIFSITQVHQVLGGLLFTHSVYRRCPCKTSYVTKFAKIACLQISIEDMITRVLTKRDFFVRTGSYVF